jgi:hypothetical protein
MAAHSSSPGGGGATSPDDTHHGETPGNAGATITAAAMSVAINAPAAAMRVVMAGIYVAQLIAGCEISADSAHPDDGGAPMTFARPRGWIGRLTGADVVMVNADLAPIRNLLLESGAEVVELSRSENRDC